MKRRHVLTQLLHDAYRDEPCREGGEKCDGRARHHWSAIRQSWTSHAGGDGSEDKNAFQSLAENEHADIEGSDGGSGICLKGIRCALDSDALPDENRDNKQCGERQADANCRSTSWSAFLRSARGHCHVSLMADFACKRAGHRSRLTQRTGGRCRSVAIF